VDSRAILSALPRSVLEELGLSSISKLPFVFPDGRKLERDMTNIILTIAERSAPIPVAFAETTDQSVLGGIALDGLGLAVDSTGKRLIRRRLRA
jgi:predicted aspartyl protease